MKRLQLTHKQKAAAKKGFTMVELSITLAFIGVLLITIAIITTNIVTIYQKGLTLKAVNSVGRGLIDELTSSINTAPSVDTTSLCHSLASYDDANLKACEDDHAFKYIFQANFDPNTGVQYNGIFCTGYYSYIWNTYYSDSNHNLKLRYLSAETGATITINNAPRLMRIEDHNYRVCSAAMNSNGKYESILSADSTIDITHFANANQLVYPVPTPTEGMLDEFDLDLMLYEFTVFPISQDSVTLRTFMSGTFILATLRGNVDITRSGDYCALGSNDTSSLNNLGAEFNYCAINKFNFAARTAGV